MRTARCWTLRLCAVVVTAAVLATPAGCAPTARFTPDTVNTRTGFVFTVAVPLEPGSGCRWQLAHALDPARLRLVGIENDAGDPSRQLWAFQALAPGRYTLLLNYVRPWDRSTARQLAVDILVR
jgi:predicted secreted protein